MLVPVPVPVAAIKRRGDEEGGGSLYWRHTSGTVFVARAITLALIVAINIVEERREGEEDRIRLEVK